MILVTVGSAEKGIEFERLIEKVDTLALKFDEPFKMQIGSSAYLPKNAEFFRYASYGMMLEYFSQARLVIGHCGAGTVLNAFQANVPLIVVPRLTQYGEIDRDDHQMLLAKKIEKYAGVSVVHKVDELEKAILNSLNIKNLNRGSALSESRRGLFEAITNFLNKED